MTTLNSQLTKRERIVSKKLIDKIFSGNSSQSLVAFPLRIVFMERNFTANDDTAAKRPEEEPPVQVLFSVSKRHFKHAVDRNRVKRQLREAYRLNKQLITKRVAADRQLCLSFIWLSDSLMSSDVVTARVKSLLKRIHL